jgi:aspartyl-tRNA(Asn)/glutamyl-tRNA(Gln) amidotransferase subunit A
MQTLAEQAEALAQGDTTARELAERALVQTEACKPAFIALNTPTVLRDADAADARRKAGRALSQFDGIPYGVKDLFDVQGEVTTAGSVLLKDRAPAKIDSDAVARLRAKGFVILGRTNMTEFAYSGLGLNPHYGTPAAVAPGAEPRIPGGSSSGTAVAVASGVCSFGLGTDTGGSCRIPAAFNGIAGFKPTALRVSKRGVFPLSESFDSIGPLAASAACCLEIDQVLSGEIHAKEEARKPVRLAVLQNFVLDGLSRGVADDYARTLTRLSQRGFELVDLRFDALDQLPTLLKNGGIVAYEASRLHATLIAERADQYDPRVVSRINLGFDTIADEYASLLVARRNMIEAFATHLRGFDAVICPTVAIEAPAMSAFAEEAEYRRLNGIVLRNTYVFNFLDGTSGSVPMHRAGEVPTGVMISGVAGRDASILAAMQHVQAALA